MAALSRLAEIADETRLRPRSQSGTKCDGEFRVGEHLVFVEVKRYYDNWLREVDADDTSEVVRRSMIPSAPEAVPPGTERPRSMALASKLERVPMQFPEGGVNLLVVFHRSIGDSWRYLQQTLFGGAAALHEPPSPPLGDDGLFATDAWNVVHGVALLAMPGDRGPFVRCLWENPRGGGVPDAVTDALGRLAEQATESRDEQ